MKTLLSRLFGLLLVGSATLLTATNALAVSHQTEVVPIPGTLLLFAAGWAGFAAWRWRQERHSKHDDNHIPS